MLVRDGIQKQNTSGRHSSVERLLLISPSIGPVTWVGNLFTADQIQEMISTGRTIRKGLTIAASFFAALQRDITPSLEQGSSRTLVEREPSSVAENPKQRFRPRF